MHNPARPHLPDASAPTCTHIRRFTLGSSNAQPCCDSSSTVECVPDLQAADWVVCSCPEAAELVRIACGGWRRQALLRCEEDRKQQFHMMMLPVYQSHGIALRIVAAKGACWRTNAACLLHRCPVVHCWVVFCIGLPSRA